MLIKPLNPEDFIILVVDDIKKNLKLISVILDNAGYGTTFATSGQQALERIQTVPVNLILLDLMMPDMNGLEVCAKLKNNPDYQSIPIIFLTASQEKKYLVKAFEQGAVDYITKPFQEEEVLARIENQLRLQQQEQALKILAEQEQQKSALLAATLRELKQTQIKLIQAQKMSTLAQTVAGITHEINNPISFIAGNINYADCYFNDLLCLLRLYQNNYPNPTSDILDLQEQIEFNFILEDWLNLINSMKTGAKRISELMLSLRHFSRLDESDIKATDINYDIDQALSLLHHRFQATQNRPDIQLIKQYGQLPKVTCYASQLNQVFMHLLNNALEALDEKANTQRESWAEPPTITIRTDVVETNDTSLNTSNRVVIEIADNGCGIGEDIQEKIFDPFFTTKPVGHGTGLGLAISYQIVVETHQGNLRCLSQPGQGTQMIIDIPVMNP